MSADMDAASRHGREPGAQRVAREGRASERRATRVRVWRMPATMAALIVAGLAIALVDGTQPWRGIAWGLLSVPLLVALIGWCGCWPPRRDRSNRL